MSRLLVCLPYIGPLDNFTACVASWGPHDADVLIVDNSPTSDLSGGVPGAEVVTAPQNLGVAASWNVAVAQEADLTVMMSCSMRFPRGLQPVLDLLRAHANSYGVLTWEAWHLIGIGRDTFQRVGRFDERFYPAYFEDNDFSYRLALVDIHGPSAILPKIQVPAICIGDAVALKAGLVRPDFAALQAYYVEKWGGLPGQETYTRPFNNPSFPLSHWVPR